MAIAESNAPVPGNITRILKAKRYKHKLVADRAGYTEQQFCDMLNGRKLIKPCDLRAISNALGVNIGELFTDAGLAGREEDAR